MFTAQEWMENFRMSKVHLGSLILAVLFIFATKVTYIINFRCNVKVSTLNEVNRLNQVLVKLVKLKDIYSNIKYR